MRADRLLSLLMLLETRGRMTAKRLAEELEVSQRTVYRDLYALRVAGFPVYTEKGPGGGCELFEDYRSNLTGLTKDEVSALFMLSVPAPLAQLGVSGELKAALLKLAAALPHGRRGAEQHVRRRVHLDSAPPFHSEGPPLHLQVIHQAVMEDRRIRLTLQRSFQTSVTRLVDPLGLVAKVNTWYVVWRGERGVIHVDRVSDVLEARMSEECFHRPADFDVAAFWASWCQKLQLNRPRYTATVLAPPETVPWLRRVFGPGIPADDQANIQKDASGRVRLALPFRSLEEARARILALGRAVEVIAPEALRRSVADYAAQIGALYDI